MRKLLIPVFTGFEIPTTANMTWGCVVPGAITGLISAGTDYAEVLTNIREVALMVTEEQPLTMVQVQQLGCPSNMLYPDTVPGFFYRIVLMDVWVQDDVEPDLNFLAERDSYRDINAELEESMSEVKFSIFNPASPSAILAEYIDKEDPDCPLCKVLSDTDIEVIERGDYVITLDNAQVLASALQTSVEYWLGIDHEYRIFHARQIDANNPVQ